MISTVFRLFFETIMNGGEFEISMKYFVSIVLYPFFETYMSA